MRRLLTYLRLRAPRIKVGGDRSVGSQTVLSTVGVLVQGGVRFVYSVLVGNAFGRLVLGAVNSAISLALFASLLIPNATGMAASKYVARARGAADIDESERVAGFLGRFMLVTMAVLGVGTALIAPTLLGLGLVESLLAGALAVTYSAYVFTRGFLFGAGQVSRATVWDVLSSALAVAGLAMLVLGDATEWLLLPLVLSYGAYAAVSWPSSRAGRIARGLRREILGFIALTLVNSVATGGFMQLTMLAAQFWDPIQAGSFAAALSLATPASLVSRSLALVLFPSLSAAHGRGDLQGARARTDAATRGLIVLGLATFGPLMLLSPLIIDLFFRRAEFDQAKVLLPLLLGAVLVTTVGVGAINSLLSREPRFSRLVVVASVSGASVGILWWVLRVPDGGVLEVALGFLVGSAAVGLLPLIAVWRLDRHHWVLLCVRLVVGSVALGGTVWWQQVHQVQPAAQIVAALVFFVSWMLLCLPDARRVAAQARH